MLFDAQPIAPISANHWPVDRILGTVLLTVWYGVIGYAVLYVAWNNVFVQCGRRGYTSGAYHGQTLYCWNDVLTVPADAVVFEP